MTVRQIDPERFGLSQLPKFKGAAATPDPDCCAAEECPQRDYQRAMILTLMRLSQAYAASLLLHWHTTQIWRCDGEGHTKDCPNPACEFGAYQAQTVRFNTDRLAMTITDFFRVLTVPAVDLTAYWQDLHDAEVAWFGLKHAAESDPPPADLEDRVALYLECWRGIVVEDDDEAYVRWFTPPDPPLEREGP